MAEQHPAEDVLLDLALGDTTEPDQDSLVGHLALCSTCRVQYDSVAKALDETLPATPRLEPDPGFDQKVLEAMGVDPDVSSDGGFGSVASRRRRRRSWQRRVWRRRTVALAAACLVGLALGASGAVLSGVVDDEPPVAADTLGNQLVTAGGEAVGTVTTARLDGEQVIVISAAGGRPGVRYECRLLLSDGDTVTVGEWRVPPDGAAWVVPAPDTPATVAELVDDTGSVWSTANLDPPERPRDL